jgi:hypothetical protein
MNSDNVTCVLENCVLLKFLYVKDILSSLPPDVRKELFERVMNPAHAGPDTTENFRDKAAAEKNCGCRQMRILLQMRFLKVYKYLIKPISKCKTGRTLGLMKYTYSTFTTTMCKDEMF